MRPAMDNNDVVLLLFAQDLLDGMRASAIEYPEWSSGLSETDADGYVGEDAYQEALRMYHMDYYECEG